MKIVTVIFIFLSILFNLNQTNGFSNEKHAIAFPKINSSENASGYLKIEKKDRRQYKYFILIVLFFSVNYYYYLDCLWRLCSWSSRKEKEQLKMLRQKFRNFKAS